MIHTLYHRADTVITNPTDVIEEKEHIDQALAKCGYPEWAFDRISKPKQIKSRTPTDIATQTKGQVVLPYVKGTSEALPWLRRIFNNHGIRACFKPTKTLRQLLVSPKDKTEKKDVVGPVYLIPCQGQTTRGQCPESYIGETERLLNIRFNEHKRRSNTSSEVSQHLYIESPGHHVDFDTVKVS